MQFTSTRDSQKFVSASQAIAQGLSDEGGLFVPCEFPKADLEAMKDMDYPTLAKTVLSGFLTDYDPAFLENAAKATYGQAFGGKAGHVAQVAEGLYSLELWHGPTCAFKDYALQLMPKLLVEAKKNLGRTEHTRILVATSGDTGKAALDGYHDVPGVSIAVFYPSHGTSEIQRLQMVTQEGSNVAVYAVKGNFDDAQTGVKRVFGDKQIAQKLEAENIRLSSANSINWGRLVPQIVYYFASYFQLVNTGKITMGERVDYCVPTGNFGDILAGYYAKRMGLPVGTLVCASNRNNVLTDFISTGTYDARREFHRTTSPSMDILVSSNLERLLFALSGQDDKLVVDYMQQLNKHGGYTVSDEIKVKLKSDFYGGFCSEEETSKVIAEVWKKYNYLIDPHTAVAYDVMEKYRQETGDTNKTVFVSTASPFKFCDSVLHSLGVAEVQDGIDALDQLSQTTNRPAPVPLASLRNKAVRFTESVDKEKMEDVVLEMLK